MKTTCLLFLTMTWAALTPGTGYAVPSPGNVSREFREPRERPSGRCRARRSASRRETSDGWKGF